MINTVFLVLLAILTSIYLLWGFKTLPSERWQIFASLPTIRDGSGRWQGVNLTWYGLLTANAYAVAVVMLFILLGAIRTPLPGIAAMTITLFILCIPASRLVARIVEKKSQTFTVGGAVFVGIIAAPWVVLCVNRTVGATMGFHVHPMAALAAFTIAYSFGEGLGRLACISFGCCYGKQLAEAPSWLRRIFTGRCFVFSGHTKKIAYASGMEGEKVLPVQAITALLYVATGLISTLLFMHARYAEAFILATIVTQGWRFLSETLRADYRGEGLFSAYQVMCLLAIPYVCGVILFAPSGSVLAPDIATGIRSLWHPAMLLFLQSIWLVIFLYTGRSTVTGAMMTFHVHRDKV
ncbi:MAG: hypothetical protein FD174_1686 [Geobacteraceae bacterium]|nr:MAG: hypothetical protein FD174_1686 [Geobacteraceae bacterium]